MYMSLHIIHHYSTVQYSKVQYCTCKCLSKICNCMYSLTHSLWSACYCVVAFIYMDVHVCIHYTSLHVLVKHIHTFHVSNSNSIYPLNSYLLCVCIHISFSLSLSLSLIRIIVISLGIFCIILHVHIRRHAIHY